MDIDSIIYNGNTYARILEEIIDGIEPWVRRRDFFRNAGKEVKECLHIAETSMPKPIEKDFIETYSQY